MGETLNLEAVMSILDEGLSTRASLAFQTSTGSLGRH